MSDSEDPVMRRARARVGAVLRNKWRLDRLIGVGGMASVYEATHRNGKRGAVKLLHPEISLEREVRERFLREGYLANKVDHPGVVSVLDDDETEDGSVFLVMELLEGQSVEATREARPGTRLELSETLAIADQLLDVLSAAHDKGIVHRDLKPENLFLTRQGQLKVLDFGIARLRDAPGSSSATRTGSMMGTPTFMPPEQALGQWADVDARTDIWAVGATIFTLVSGRTVHLADSLNKLLLAAMTQPAPPLASVLPSVPPAIASVVDRALAFERAKRWPDARAMRDALRAAQPTLPAGTLPAPRAAVGVPVLPTTVAASSVVSPRLPSMSGVVALPVSSTLVQPPRRSRTGPVIAAAVATIGVVGAGALLLLRQSDDRADIAAEGNAPVVQEPPTAPASSAPAASESAPVAPLASAVTSAEPVVTAAASVSVAAPALKPAKPPSKPAAPKPPATPATPPAKPTSNPLDQW